MCYRKSHLFQEALSDAPGQWLTTVPEPLWSLALAPFIGAEKSPPSPLFCLLTPQPTMLKLIDLLYLPQTVFFNLVIKITPPFLKFYFLLKGC